MELRDIQLQIGGQNEKGAAEESATTPGQLVPGAKDEGKLKKDKVKTVDDLKQEIEMVKLLQSPHCNDVTLRMGHGMRLIKLACCKCMHVLKINPS